MVSVIITTHNRIELLKRAIESVLIQTYKEYECIVVDDASSDGTEEYMVSLNNPKITYYRILPENSRGGNYARNVGIALAKGEYLAFLDDDDCWFKEKLEKQVAVLEKNLDVGLVYCWYIKDYIQENRQEKYKQKLMMRGDMSKKIFAEIMTITSCVLVRREIVERVGGFDEKLGFWQEYDFCIRVCQITQVDYVKQHLVVVRCDKKDKNRLSNKYNGWAEAVKYHNKKYKKQINELSDSLKQKRKIMIYSEAIMRTDSWRKRKVYWRKLYQLTKEPEDYISYLLNRKL